MAGTLKRGGASAPNTRTVWNFYSPAGKTKTLKTQKDPTKSAEVGQSEVNGAGSVAPIFIAQGFGKASWKTEIAKHEWHEIVALARSGNVPVMGVGGLAFDIIMTTTVNGLPKMTTKVLGCTIGKFEDKTAADGDMVSLEGAAMNVDVDGVLMFTEAA